MSDKSKNILFIDTETTGLPANETYKKHVHECLDEWPRMMELAFILTDEVGETIVQFSEIIHPGSELFNIDEKALETHGITNDKAINAGLSVSAALGNLRIAMGQAQLLVGHGITFDRKIIGAELLRFDYEEDYQILNNMDRICTMMKSTNHCGLMQKGSNRKKWPTLQELHQHLFGKDFEGAHGALADITATKDCYFELKRLGVV